MSRSSSGSASPIEAASQPRRVDKDDDEDDEEEDETITQLVIGGTTKRLTVNGGELDQIDENQIVTLNESVSLISRDVLNNEIQSSLIDELDTKYVIVRHNAATKTRNDEISEEALIDKSIMEMRRQLVSSSSWPSIMLTSSKQTKDESTTKKQSDEYSTIGKSISTAINEDKSYQVNAVDLPGAMVDTHTQMTPPLSPKTEEAKKKMMSRSSSMKKSVATETDELSDEGLFSEKMISSEERRLRKKLLEKENELRSVSIATQTLFESTDEGLAATASELSWTRVEQEVFY